MRYIQEDHRPKEKKDKKEKPRELPKAGRYSVEDLGRPKLKPMKGTNKCLNLMDIRIR